MTVDGRTARRDRNREAVLDAAIELFGEGRTPPTPTEVAERSGVSLRSVYRYFSDHDALVTAAVARFVEGNESYFELDVAADAPLADRITRLVDARVRLYERVAPVARVAVRRSDEVPAFATQFAVRRQLLADQTVVLFQPELAAADPGVVDVVDALTQFDGIQFLRVHRGLSKPRTRAALEAALSRLLGG